MADGRATVRQWADLKLWRVGLGLVIAPLPIIVLIIGGAAAVEQPSPQRLLWYVRIAFEWALGWSILTGIVYLLVVTPWRRRIARAECLALGGFTVASLPYAALTFRHYAPQPLLDFFALKPHATPLLPALFDWRAPADYAIPAMLLALGLFDGWVFWRLGIRPAAEPPPDTAIFE